jgi:ATP-dependent protease HslVU (ClpYQ) peptidase subunit
VTTIVAKVTPTKVQIGSDSLVTATRKYSHPQMVKVVERGPYIIAGAGLSSFCDVIQHIWKPPAPIASDRADLYHFVISRVVPSMKDCLKNNDLKWDKDNDDDETQFAFLIAIGGEVFDIADDFAVCLDSDGIYGIGSGSSLAIGALKAGASIKKALEIAADKDPYTAAPFIYFEQERWTVK